MFFQAMRIRYFALPDYQRLPTNFRQRRYILFVAFLVALQLRLRNVRALAAVRVPETPSTKIAFLRLGNTMSGVSGRDRSWSLNRNPARCNTDRNLFSGFVSPDRIRCIRALRSDGVRMSVTYAFLGPPRSAHAPQSAAPRSRPEFPCDAVAVGITP